MSQVLLLLKKNAIIQIRKVSVTCCEIVTPLLFVFLCLVIRHYAEFDEKNRHNIAVYSEGEIAVYDGGKNRTKLIFSPDNSLTKSIMQAATFLKRPVQIKGFNSEEEMVRGYLSDHRVVYAGIVFNNLGQIPISMPDKVQVTIRLAWAIKEKWYTRDRFPGSRSPLTRSPGGYGSTGFVNIQRAITKSIIQMRDPSNNWSNVAVWDYEMPTIELKGDTVLDVIGYVFPAAIMLSFLLHVAQTTKNIVTEKERRLKVREV